MYLLELFSLLFFPLALVNAVIENKYCVNCRHFITPGLLSGPEYGRCKKFLRNGREHEIKLLVTGKSAVPDKKYFFCSTARDVESMCGSEGKFYKAKNLVKKRNKPNKVKNNLCIYLIHKCVALLGFRMRPELV